MIMMMKIMVDQDSCSKREGDNDDDKNGWPV